MNYRIFPPEGYLEGQMTLPLSKSMSNRALIISALTEGVSSVDDVVVADCDDCHAVVRAIASVAAGERTVDVGAAGTAMRFLTAYFASRPGTKVTVDGSPRMRQRPIGPLVDALRALGAKVDYTGEEGFPPVTIEGRRLDGGEIEVDSSVSSQFVSALLMIAPVMKNGLKVRLSGEPVSLPYILMTLRMMDEAGAVTDFYGGDTIEVEPVPYTRPTLPVEGDWSAAAFAYQIQALAMGEMKVSPLTADSCQGDAFVKSIFANLGVETADDGDGSVMLTPSPECSPRMVVDMAGTPDLVQPLVATCVTLGVPFRLSGAGTLRNKETDRLEALKTEMLKLGAILETPAEGMLEWDGRRRPVEQLPVFDTYDDHRMAMSLAPLAVAIPGIVINDPQVVTKSFPGFWDNLRQMGFVIVDAALSQEEVAAMLGLNDMEQ